MPRVNNKEGIDGIKIQFSATISSFASKHQLKLRTSTVQLHSTNTQYKYTATQFKLGWMPCRPGTKHQNSIYKISNVFTYLMTDLQFDQIPGWKPAHIHIHKYTYTYTNTQTHTQIHIHIHKYKISNH